MYIEKLATDIRRAVELVLTYTCEDFNLMNEAEVYAVRYNLIVIAEDLTTLSLHISRRLFGEEPETLLHAFRILRDKGFMNEEEYRDVVNLVKLRNLLVHRYWAIDDRRIHEDVKGNFKNVLSFIDRVVKLVR